MQSSKEQQAEIRKPSSVLSAKKKNENNKMGKTLFNKIRDTRVTFHAKMGSINDRNGMDLTEAEDTKMRQKKKKKRKKEKKKEDEVVKINRRTIQKRSS